MTSDENGDNSHESHAYLGSLETVDHIQRPFYPEYKVLTLPLIYLPDIVLFPGDDLPLRLLPDSLLGGIQDLLSSVEGSLLAVLPLHQTRPHYGVTVQVERFRVEDRSARMTGAARQRFRLKKRLQADQSAGIAYGQVEILPQDRAPAMPFDRLCWQRQVDDQKSASTKRPRSLQRLRDRQFPAYYGRATYALYDARVLVDQIQHMLLTNMHGKWFRKPRRTNYAGERASHDEEEQTALVQYLSLPSDRQDPNLFAFWVARNLPLDTAQRLELLTMDSTVRLLRREIELLAQVQEDVFCFSCGSFLANTRDIFSMTARGTAGGTFVNPGGRVFQVLTLREVDRAHVVVDMARRTEDTWFEGYAWSIAHCNCCYQHLGWRFDRVEATRAPATFFGFRRTALTRSRDLRQVDPRSLPLDGYDTDDFEPSVASSDGSSATAISEDFSSL